MRHNNPQKRLHPTRWLLAMSVFLMLPGMAAAQSIDAYGETNAAMDGVDACFGLDERYALPDLPAGEARAQVDGAIGTLIGITGEVTGDVPLPAIPVVDTAVDVDVQTAQLDLQAGADENGLHADACAAADTPEIPATGLGVGAGFTSSIESSFNASVQHLETAYEAAAGFFARAYVSMQALF